MKTCPCCGKPLPERPPGATGRPPTYCSATCRRLSEFAIKRITRRIDGLEDRLCHLQLNRAFHSPKYLAQQKDEIEVEIARQETRLRELLERLEEGEPDDA